ncbi:hypothetical protein [Methylocystis echinoides]|jgi:hypothetical protein|uniref:hypothetical protein n=1 Tax=Methylocystis echinoides TaxID=29468 RepID=UPI00342B1B9F
MGRRGVYLAAGAAALILLLLWLFLPVREEDVAGRIERSAGFDLVAACNEAAGGRARFAPGDVRQTPAETPHGVVALASVLEARRDGLICRWNGVDPPTILRARP